MKVCMSSIDDPFIMRKMLEEAYFDTSGYTKRFFCDNVHARTNVLYVEEICMNFISLPVLDTKGIFTIFGNSE